MTVMHHDICAVALTKRLTLFWHNKKRQKDNLKAREGVLHGTKNMTLGNMCRNHSPEVKTEGHLLEILGNFPSIKSHSLTSRAIKSQRGTDLTYSTNRKWVSWQERGPCFRFRRVPTHPALQRETYESAKMVSVSAVNFGNNLLREKERIWKQFVTVQPSFLFPPTKVVLTIDLSMAWMAFPSILGCHCCSQTELFNSVLHCCFSLCLQGKALKLLLYGRSYTTEF